MDETDAAAAEAQSGENESDPDLALCPPASPAGNTFWCQCGECFARDRRKDCVCCYDYVERVEKVHSASNDCTVHRSTTVAVDLPLFARIFLQLLVLDGVERLFGHDQAPPKCLPSNKWVEIFCFRHLRFLTPSMDGSFTIVCIFFTNFCSSGSYWSRRAATQQTSSKFLVPRKSMKAHAILSMLVVLAAAESSTLKKVFSVAVQPGWLCHARNPLDRRAVQKPWNCQLAERQTRRVDVFYQNLPHVRNSESRFTSTCLPRSRFLCDRRSTRASRTLEICATRATNKVHIDEQVVGESKKRSLTSL